MSWAIISDARSGSELGISTLALVDRTKTRSTWWTSDTPHYIMKFNKLEAAKKVSNRLTLNSPKVVSYNEAVNIISDQADCIDFYEDDPSWDAHKSY